MNDEQLLRYSRHILLPQIDIAGQEKLMKSSVFIIGLGGLGSIVSLYLAAAGVGHLILADFDNVDLSNLQRQILYHTDSIGQSKVEAAQKQLILLNPEIKITLINHYINENILNEYVEYANIVVDCCDNFSTRFTINSVCVRHQTPLVSGAAIRFTGQVSVFLPAQPDSPCYHCLYHNDEEQAETCSETGIISPLSGIIGSVQAIETLKILVNSGQSLYGKLLIFDALTLEWKKMTFKKDFHCPICSKQVT